jgi:hypothetical protein
MMNTIATISGCNGRNRVSIPVVKTLDGHNPNRIPIVNNVDGDNPNRIPIVNNVDGHNPGRIPIVNNVDGDNRVSISVVKSLDRHNPSRIPTVNNLDGIFKSRQLSSASFLFEQIDFPVGARDEIPLNVLIGKPVIIIMTDYQPASERNGSHFDPVFLD